MAFFKAKYLVCGGGCGRFSAKDALGVARKGAATVRSVVNDLKIPQFCPRCGKEWKGIVS